MARLAHSVAHLSGDAVSIQHNVTDLADYKRTRLVRLEEATLGRIKVIGVGNAGGNAVNHLIESDVQGVEFLVVNTDPSALSGSRASVKIQLDEGIARGVNAGGNPELGKQAALEDADRLLDVLKDADIVFVTAGFYGGTVEGAAPVIARLAAELGAFTIAIVTEPAAHETEPREAQPEGGGIDELLRCVDCIIRIPTERSLESRTKTIHVVDREDLLDKALSQAVRGISDIVGIPGLINVDLADVIAIMRGRRVSLMGFGAASGENRAIEAVRIAITTPLLREVALEKAEALVVNVTGSSDVSLFEVCEAMDLIHQSASPEANIIFGCVIDERLSDEIRITVIATHLGTPEMSSELSSDKRAILREGVTAELNSLLNRMQNSNVRRGMKAAFNSSGEQLGRAAVEAARERLSLRELKEGIVE